MTFFLFTMAWAQEATYKQYPPDASIKTCDEFIEQRKKNLTELQNVSKLPDSPIKQEKGKEVYARVKTLQSTMFHLENTGVIDQECKLRLAKSQADQGVKNGMMSQKRADQTKLIMEIQHQLQACNKQCASTHSDNVEKKQACIKTCSENAQKSLSPK